LIVPNARAGSMKQQAALQGYNNNAINEAYEGQVQAPL
jgi:hypothetical protein